MKVDPKFLEKAKAELCALVALGEVSFDATPAPSNGKDVFVGIKLKPSMYRWVKSCANQYTSGNVNGFIRAVLESVKANEENTHHASKPTRKRIPS